MSRGRDCSQCCNHSVLFVDVEWDSVAERCAEESNRNQSVRRGRTRSVVTSYQTFVSVPIVANCYGPCPCSCVMWTFITCLTCFRHNDPAGRYWDGHLRAERKRKRGSTHRRHIVSKALLTPNPARTDITVNRIIVTYHEQKCVRCVCVNLCKEKLDIWQLSNTEAPDPCLNADFNLYVTVLYRLTFVATQCKHITRKTMYPFQAMLLFAFPPV